MGASVADTLMRPACSMRESTKLIRFRGRRVSLRALQARDRPLLEDLVRRTESHDLRMRFFGGGHPLPPALFAHLTLIDPEHRITLVASGASGRGGEPEILAIACAHVLTQDSAEVALLVRSDLKGMGMGSVLLDRLISYCRERGFTRLVIDVLNENARMFRLADKYGFRRQTPQRGTTKLVRDLNSLTASELACGFLPGVLTAKSAEPLRTIRVRRGPKKRPCSRARSQDVTNETPTEPTR